MNLATNLFIVYNVFFILTYVKLLFSKKKRKKHKQTRKRMKELRNISNKTIEQQKEFVNLKYPKSNFEWSFKNVMYIILRLAMMVGIFMGVRYLWSNFVGFEFTLWRVVLYAIIFPIILNTILKQYNLEQDDLTVFFRRD